MRCLFIILFCSFSFNFFSLEDKIEFKDFGIISIGNNLNYLGKHVWEINFFLKDSLHSLIIKSKTNDKYIYYNLSKKLEIKRLEFLEKQQIKFTIYKDENKIFEKKIKINFKTKNSYFIQITKKPINKNIRGKIKDFYKVETEKDQYTLVRTVQKDFFIYWYILKNDEIIKIHSEKKEQKEFNYGQIIVTNFFDKNIPEFTFIYKTNNNVKLITLSENFKIITDKNETKKSNIPFDNSNYRGFLHYNLKKIG